LPQGKLEVAAERVLPPKRFENIDPRMETTTLMILGLHTGKSPERAAEQTF
jgi:hypothetical protein